MGLLDALFSGGLFPAYQQIDPERIGAGSPWGMSPAMGAMPQGVLANNQPSPLDTAQWPAGPMGAPSALPQNAQPTQGQMPPAMQSPGFGDHLGAGLKSFLGNLHGGPIAALAGGIGGLATGQRNDPYGRQLNTQNMTVQALISRGVNPQEAMLAASNPDMMKALLPRLWPTYKPHNVGNTVGAWNESTGTYTPRHTEPKYEKVGQGDTLYRVGGGSAPGGAATAPVPLIEGGPKFDDMASLRKEFLARPNVKKFEEAIGAYSSMLKSASKDTPASDLDLITGLAKMLDPDSVVREGEFETVRKSQAIPDQVRGYFQFLIEGKGKLDPNARQAIMDIARTRIEAYRGQTDTDVTHYTDLAKRNKFDPAQIVRSFPETQRYQKPDAGPPRVKSMDEALKLKPGTKFIDPNGVERIR